MNRIHRSIRASVRLSYIFTGVFVLLLLALCFLLPRLVPSLLSAPDLIGDRTELAAGTKSFILFLSYLIVAIALAAIGFLIFILRCVERGKVFSASVVRALNGVSLCCLAEGIVFLIIGIWFQLSLLVFSMAGFLALCLHIVANVISVAAAYKAENDLTV